MPPLPTLLAAWPLLAIGSPAPPATSPLPTIDPQARQVLADIVNAYGFGLEEYADVETIQATGDTKAISPRYVNSRFTVALSKGFGCLFTATDMSGAKVTVHSFQQYPSQADTPFLVITTDSRFPNLYVKDVATDYDEAQKEGFWHVGWALGAEALFSERNFGSLLLHPDFRGLTQGPSTVVDGAACKTVMIEIDNDRGSNTDTLSIGQEDHLLRRLTVAHIQGDQKIFVTENHTHIRTHGSPAYPFILTPSYFRYAPLHGARRVEYFPAPPVLTHG